MFLYILGYSVDRPIGINSENFVELLIMIDDWLWMFIEDMQPFLDNFFIVIGSSTWLSSLQKPFDQLILFAIEV